MRLARLLLITTSLVLISVVAQADNSGRIYGKIRTVDGDTFEGIIRWDKNEGSWVDILNGTRDRDDRNRDSRSRSSKRKYRDKFGSSIRVFGIRINNESDNNFFFDISSAESGIRFGHLKSLEPIDDDRVLLTLKNGEEVEFSSGSTDFGSGIREIVIEDSGEGEVELDWNDIELIEFSESRYDKASVFGERLYGTLTTRRGDEFTGFACWDVDELFDEDVLDGDDKRRSREVELGEVATITRYSSSGAELLLKNGNDLILRGTNDVNEGNRGICISDPAFGQVKVGWGDFEKLELKSAPRSVTYSEFNGGRKIKGTVYTEGGEEYAGEITWDDDEEYTWELLDGDCRGLEFDIEFGFVKQIEKNSHRVCDVTILDGRVFRLSGSNDVDEDNKGVIITQANGDDTYVDWEDFSRAVFDNK
jgi:hypothetical protein